MIFRWLGAAGIELRDGGEVLVIDPYLTRAPMRRLFIGRVPADRRMIRHHLPSCDHLLITHAHFDHVMDGGEVLVQSGKAQGYGSPNACRLMVTMGSPQEILHEIDPGDRLELGPFSVDVFPVEHRRTPIDGWINGDLPQQLEAPLRLLDYRMDAAYGFRIEADRIALLVGDLPLEADVLFTVPLSPQEHYARLLTKVHPSVLVPIHWDDFFRSLDEPLRPTFRPPSFSWPPLGRLDIQDFKRKIEKLTESTEVLIPEIFKSYALSNDSGAACVINKI